jgi:hypothetical protein
MTHCKHSLTDESMAKILEALEARAAKRHNLLTTLKLYLSRWFVGGAVVRRLQGAPRDFFDIAYVMAYL